MPSTPIKFSLAGKHCLVTGATGVIGSAITHLFAVHGAVVTVFSRRRQVALDLVARLPERRSLDGLGHGAEVLDLGDDVEGRVGEIWKTSPRLSKVDVLINAAGISLPGAILRQDSRSIEATLNTNLYAAMAMTKHAASRMKTNPEGGCIINILSILATKGGRGHSAYAASKAGLLGFTRALASELGPYRIRTNAILPGYIRSAMVDSMLETSPDGSDRRLAATIPVRRLGEPEEVARAALFLVENGYANNCHLNLDGGLSAE